MGFARRVVRKSVRKATPRTVRKAMHPVRTAKNAVTPRPIKQASRAIYTVTNPIGAAENALIGAALYPNRRSRSRGSSRSTSTTQRVSTGPTATERRSAEGAAAHTALERLMMVGREKFNPLPPPTVPTPPRVDSQAMARLEWRARRKEVSIWGRPRRAALQQLIHDSVMAHAAAHDMWAQRAANKQQAVADTWWRQLQAGDRAVVTSVLVAAFSDNPAPVEVIEASGSSAVLHLHLPSVSVLPERKANITPSGQLSTKAWTKTELNQVYAQLLAIHLLATLRESWAVAPSLQSIRVIGRSGPGRSSDFVFDVGCTRTSPDTHIEDADGARMEAWLTTQELGLLRTGRTREVVVRTPSPDTPHPTGRGTGHGAQAPLDAPWAKPAPDHADPEPAYLRPPVPDPTPASATPASPLMSGGRRHATGTRPPGAPSQRRVGPGLAFLASFFVAGLGSMLNRRRVGALIFVGWLVSLLIIELTPTHVGAFAVFPWIACWVWGLIDAVVGARPQSSAPPRHAA